MRYRYDPITLLGIVLLIVLAGLDHYALAFLSLWVCVVGDLLLFWHWGK